MAKKRQKAAAAGAPEWMVTYGDMVTLLLCFFVLIVSFSEIKREDEFQAVVEEIKKAFGMKGGGGKIPTPDDPELSLIEKLEYLELKKDKQPSPQEVNDPAIEGETPTVKTIRPGELYAVGGPIVFEPGSAELSEASRVQLGPVIEEIKGANNLILIKGHTARLEIAGRHSDYKDLWELSFARSKAIFDYLTSEDVGLRSERFKLISAADKEPLIERAYSLDDQQPNRRAELMVSASIVDDYSQPTAVGGP
ncbi:OmpA/MotB family protein [Mucisphaera calidilacus]|uniref:Flagellar motor protein MotB n=1 Tax=Mucisphaera calidilacus TaxID=2527982 RepID=A0A518BYX6_9BACT|nr:flagellar motor protein MotB [Mucisphaera calidilacus]QDU72164.1 flagellar motor protein MotB [Mucisphaera calidilacus]